MKKLLFISLFIFCSTLHAEDVVKYNGTEYQGCQTIGDSRVWLNDPNDISTVKDGYLYLPNGCKSLPAIADKYKKVSNGVVVEMSQLEKDAVDSAEQQAQLQASKEQFNSLIEQAKVEVDTPKSVSALLNLCISGITTEEIRNIKKGTPKSSQTDSQLKASVKACLESLKQ